MLKRFCDYCESEIPKGAETGSEIRVQLWNEDTHEQSEPAGEVIESDDMCVKCQIIINKALHEAFRKCKGL